MNARYLTGLLLAAAGVLFLLAGILRRLEEPLWILLAVACVGIGVVVLRGASPE